MIEGFAYFPAIVYRDERPEWVDHTLKLTEKYFKEPNNQYLIQTGSMIEDNNMNFLKDYLLSTSKDILIGQGYDMSRYELFISEIWGQEIKGPFGTNVHVHRNSQLCGWFFLETPENGSYPIYYDSRSNKSMVELDMVSSEGVTNAMNSIHFNNLLPGTILMNNSWLNHQITGNMSEKSTKCIHFVISHKQISNEQII